MPNQISHIGQVIAQDSGAPAVPRPSPSVPAEAANVSLAQPSTHTKHTESAALSVDSAVVKHAAEQINEFIKKMNSNNLLFSMDKTSGRIVVKVVDHETGEVIRQIPAEETLAIARNLDTPQGVIIRSKA